MLISSSVWPDMVELYSKRRALHTIVATIVEVSLSSWGIKLVKKGYFDATLHSRQQKVHNCPVYLYLFCKPTNCCLTVSYQFQLGT